MKKRTRPVDDLVWIEGHRREYKPGLPEWTCVYCYHLNDLNKAHAVVNRIQQTRSLGQKLPDRLGESFDGFRIKMPGEQSDADTLIDDIRNNLGGWALMKILRSLGNHCKKINVRTGGICMKPINHSGNHSASP